MFHHTRFPHCNGIYNSEILCYRAHQYKTQKYFTIISKSIFIAPDNNKSVATNDILFSVM